MHRFFSHNVSARVEKYVRALSTGVYTNEQIEQMATDLVKYMVTAGNTNEKVAKILRKPSKRLDTIKEEARTPKALRN